MNYHFGMSIFLAILAYACNAVASLIDKILLNDKGGDPTVYTFLITILSGFGIFAAFFGASFIPLPDLAIAFLIAVFSVIALLCFFRALEMQEASRVVPIVGMVQPMVIFVLANVFLGERLGIFHIIGIFLCLSGGWLLTRDKRRTRQFEKNKKWLAYSLTSGFCFSIMYVLSKYLYESVGFIDGFVWPRVMGIVVILSFLISSWFRKRLFSAQKIASKKSKAFLFFFGQACGAMFFVLIHYAISLGSVTIVNGLQSIQYVFVFAISIFISRWRPWLLKEDFSRASINDKIFALLLVIAGLFFFSFA